MRIAIFGAEDGMGRALTERTLAAGHAVNTHASEPRYYPIDRLEYDRLTVIEGDAFDVRCVERIVRNADAVCTAIGLGTDEPPGVAPSDGTANILGAMDQYLVPRIVTATAAGVGNSAEYAGLGSRLRGLFDRERFADFARQERLVRESDREWVIVRPARLTDGPATGTYRVGSDVETGLRSSVPRADLAAFMLEGATEDTYRNRPVTIAE
jgi:putative NADH-flavin reductase